MIIVQRMKGVAMDNGRIQKRLFIIGSLYFLIVIGVFYTENPLSHYVSLKLVEESQFEIIRNLYNETNSARLRTLFDRQYDYVELVNWTHDQLEYVDKKPNPIPKTPFEILELGEGRCGEFTILYCGACIAHGYEARIVLIVRGSDHEWVEVKIDGEWIHVDPTNPPMIHINEPSMYRDRNKKLDLVIAFDREGYEIVTDVYS